MIPCRPTRIPPQSERAFSCGIRDSELEPGGHLQWPPRLSRPLRRPVSGLIMCKRPVILPNGDTLVLVDDSVAYSI